MACRYKQTKATFDSTIASKTNEVLLRNLHGISDTGRDKWYDHNSLLHRYYMRKCREEALRRGLDIPPFKPHEWSI